LPLVVAAFFAGFAAAAGFAADFFLAFFAI